MIKLLRRLWKDRRGNAIMIGAAALPIIVGAAGLATDTIQWTLWKRQLQRAADSAAIAGVYDRQNAAGATTNTSTAVSKDLDRNLHTWMSLVTSYPQLSYPASAGQLTNQVSVTLAVQQSLPFSGMFISTAPTIIARSTAASVSLGDPCVLALDPSATNAVYFSGNAEVNMPQCPVFSDSCATNAAVAKGSSSVVALSVGACGSIAKSSNFTVGAYYPYSTSVPDPFADVVVDPAAMHCTTAELNEDFNWSTVGTTNCFGSLKVKSNKTLTVPSSYTGPIYINGGDVDFQGNFTCTSCTIVLTNSSTASTATIGNVTANAGANVNIAAPATGAWAGLAMYQDRRAADCSNCNKVNGNSASQINGALYFPKQELQYNGTGSTAALCSMFVASRVTFTGNSGTNQFAALKDCAAYGLKDFGAMKIIRLVS